MKLGGMPLTPHSPPPFLQLILWGILTTLFWLCTFSMNLVTSALFLMEPLTLIYPHAYVRRLSAQEEVYLRGLGVESDRRIIVADSANDVPHYLFDLEFM